MKKRLSQSLVVVLFLLVMFNVADSREKKEVIELNRDTAVAGVCNLEWPTYEASVIETEVVTVAEEEPVQEPTLEDTALYLQYKKMGYSDEDFYDDLEILALVTYAEAGNQSELGKRLVIDTVLNRIDSPVWRDDDTILEVVTHPGQFEAYSNGSYARYELDEEIVRLVEEELFNRTNYQVIFFKTNGFFDGCPPIVQEGDHYFSADYPRG